LLNGHTHLLGTQLNKNNIQEISQLEVVQRFGAEYRKEKLSCAPTKETVWFANDYTCASLYWATPTKARIKGTVTRPEYRNQGHGSSMLLYLLENVEAKSNNLGKPIEVESYARNPKWYLDNKFVIKRITPWGVTVVTRIVNGNHGGN